MTIYQNKNDRKNELAKVTAELDDACFQICIQAMKIRIKDSGLGISGNTSETNLNVCVVHPFQNYVLEFYRVIYFSDDAVL